jgi:DNA-binding NarL/FixJ family response regulator
MAVLPFQRDPLDALSPRELQMLALMAEGYSNAGICALHHLSEKTVEAHVRSIFRKLDIPVAGLGHRRVLAVLIYLDATRRFRRVA